MWIITDDYNGRVQLTDDELENLIRVRGEMVDKRVKIALDK